MPPARPRAGKQPRPEGGGGERGMEGAQGPERLDQRQGRRASRFPREIGAGEWMSVETGRLERDGEHDRLLGKDGGS